MTSPTCHAVQDIILKHFPNFRFGETGKYHNVSMDDLKRMAEDILSGIPREAVLEESAPSIDFMRLDIAGKAMQGLLSNPSGCKGERSVAERALSMADALIDAHLGSLDTFIAKVGDGTDASSP